MKILKRSGFKHMRFHDLRRLCARLFYEKSMDIKDIQMWLGHADIQTCNIYTHITKLYSKTIDDNLAAIFSLYRCNDFPFDSKMEMLKKLPAKCWVIFRKLDFLEIF